jgi:glutamate--cysteine ligase
VRTLDLSAADPVGMNQQQLRFIEALLIDCLLSESPPISAAEQTEIDTRDLRVAREGRRPGLTVPVAGQECTLASAGLQVLERVGAVAQLLDADAEGFVAAVEAAREALRDPSRTPSAALLAALKTERASFFEYSLALAKSHMAYFRDFALAPEREKVLDEMARRSLDEADSLVRDDRRPFEAYLRDYFAQV